jgi:phosphatidate cytidylyltransferase
MLGAIIWSQVSLYVLLLIISSFSLYELYFIFRSRGFAPLSYTGMLAGIVILSLVFLERQALLPHKFLLLIIPVVLTIWLAFFIKGENIITSLMITISGIIYIVLPLSLIPFLTQNKLLTGYDPQIMLGVLFIIWTYDTGAYITGILIGKHKMAPRLSPKKSWEGLAGGVVAAILISLLISGFFNALSRTDWMVISVLVVAFSTAGDLFESLIKREAGIKDSGKSLPGHGGFLDRFDSLFFAVPIVFLYIYLLRI